MIPAEWPAQRTLNSIHKCDYKCAAQKGTFGFFSSLALRVNLACTTVVLFKYSWDRISIDTSIAHNSKFWAS